MELPPDFSKLLNEAMQNPELVNLAKNLANSGNMPNFADQPAQADSPYFDDDSPTDSSFSPNFNQPSHTDSDRIALLSALKPYLGDSRREKIDTILRLLEVVSVARASHLFDSLDFGSLLKMR